MTQTPRPRRGAGRVISLLVLVAILDAIARAAPPEVDYLYPAGGKQDSTFAVVIGNKADHKINPWPAKVWADCPGLEFKPVEANGGFTARISKDAPVGPHLVRVYNDDGSSAPHVFIVDRHPEVLEQEPNDDLRNPQPIATVPAIVNGRLDKSGDVDCYGVQVEAGRWLVAELAARRLGSLVDPAMHVYDPDGVEVAFNHDTFGLDPLVAYRAPRSGRYVVQVIGFDYPPTTEVRFSGSKAAVYRLLITTGPYARYAFPLGVPRGAKQALNLFGWNLGASGIEKSCGFDAAGVLHGLPQALLTSSEIDNTLPIMLDDAPELTPPLGQTWEQPIEVKLPAVLSARLEHASEAHRFSFSATKGAAFSFAVTASALGLPLDPVLTLEDAEGKSLVQSDDSDGSLDPSIEWTAPGDGKYIVALADLNHRGGEDYVYRLEMRPTPADCHGTVDGHAVRLEAGKSAELKVTTHRRGGFATPLGVVLADLPEGVTATTPGASSNSDVFPVILSATASAAAANQPIHVLLVSADPDHPMARPATFDLGPDLLVRKTESVWLTVIRPPPATQPAATQAAR